MGFAFLVGEIAKRPGRKPSRRKLASELRFTTFEKREVMPDRQRLISTLQLTASLVLLALLASGLVAPIQMSGSVSVSSRPDCLLRTLALPSGQVMICSGEASGLEDVPKLKAIPSEDEEQDWADALNGSCVSSLYPWSFGKVPERHPIARPSIPSLYPLRC
jgi:hypothetical protein